ncbi:MAG: hypothetical protein FWG52_06950, partial [Proteobacteria bacterium]|nr:hypothetical protein [Pseudomonadota bacterium]
GGGGGGGSSSFGGGSGTTFTTSGMAGGKTPTSTLEFSDADTTANALASAGSGVQEKLKSLFGIGESYYLRIESNGSVSVLFDEAFTSAKLYTANGVDFAVMSTLSERSSGGGVQEDYRIVAWLGKLDYASFGYWMNVLDVKGTVEQYVFDMTFIGSYEEYFYDGKKADYNSQNLSFTGVAAGVAEHVAVSGSNLTAIAIPLLGTAALKITNATAGTLELAFPNFYKFTGYVNTAADGRLTGEFTSLQKLGASAIPDLPTNMSQFMYKGIEGQLYGASPSSPTEAAGSWELMQDVAGSTTSIKGVFGVKK